MGMKISTVRTSTGLVEKYVGTMYDTVKKVADDIDNVNTTADSIASVNIVAPSIGSVNTVAASQDKVDTVADNILDVNTIASTITNVNIAAENVLNINTFANVWQGSSATDLSIRTTGGALQTGDLYFNTASESIKVWNGLAWSTQSPFAGVREVIELASGQTDVTFTSNLAGANIFVFGTDVDNSRLLQGVDYTPNFSNNTLVLTQTYPAGSLLVSEQADVSTTLDASILPYTPDNNLSGSVGQALDNRQKVFDNVVAMQADSTLYIGQKVRTLGYHSVGDGGGCDYEIVAAGSGNNYGFLFEQLSGSELEAKLLGGGVMEDKTAYIPSDYATLQEAIDDLSKLRVLQGAKIYLAIESAHLPVSGIVVNEGDYSHFYVSSQDPEVTLSSAFPAGSSFIRGNYSTMPVLDCLVDAQGRCDDGYSAWFNSKGYVSESCGVKNAAGRGVYANASVVHCHRAIWSGASGPCVWATRGSMISGEQMDCTNSGDSAVVASRLSEIYCFEVDVSGASLNGFVIKRSRCMAEGAIVANVGGIGVSVFRGGQFFADEESKKLLISNSGGVGIECDRGSLVSANGCSITKPGSFGVRCLRTSVVSVNDSLIDGINGEVAQDLVRVENGSQVDVISSELKNGGRSAIAALSGSTVTCVNSVITDCSRFGIETDSSIVNAKSVTVSGMGLGGVNGNYGSKIVISTGSVKNNTGNDLNIARGSVIEASGCETTNGVGGPAPADSNRSFNTLHPAGIIYSA